MLSLNKKIFKIKLCTFNLCTFDSSTTYATLTNYVNFSKFLNISETQFLHLYHGNNSINLMRL